ncbi:MAG: hypothetical protein QW228_03535 [Candidatus Aenigmatarchaeota archaeon]
MRRFKIIFWLTITTLTTIFGQLNYSGYISLNSQTLLGYDFEIGQVMKRWAIIEGLEGDIPVKVKYGWNQIDIIRLGNPSGLNGETGIGIFSDKYELLFIISGLSYEGVKKLTFENTTPGVIYYTRLWNSNMLPLVYTDRPPNYVGLQNLLLERSYSAYFLKFQAKFKKFFVFFNYTAADEYERYHYQTFAKYYILFNNKVDIIDTWLAKRSLYGLVLGVNMFKHFYPFEAKLKINIEGFAGAGAVVNSLKFSNYWIDTDSFEYMSGNVMKPGYYHGTLAFIGRVAKVNFTGACGLKFGIQPKADIELFWQVSIETTPNFLFRYTVENPWGIGTPVNAPPGLYWREVKENLLNLKITLLGLKAFL